MLWLDRLFYSLTIVIFRSRFSVLSPVCIIEFRFRLVGIYVLSRVANPLGELRGPKRSFSFSSVVLFIANLQRVPPNSTRGNCVSTFDSTLLCYGGIFKIYHWRSVSHIVLLKCFRFLSKYLWKLLGCIVSEYLPCPIVNLHIAKNTVHLILELRKRRKSNQTPKGKV